MKKVIGLILISGLVIACSSNVKKETEESKEGISDTIKTTIDDHNAKNSLDYRGEYKGSLPCADCDSITVDLTLRETDYTKISVSHKNKTSIKSENKGSYTWNEAGNTIILEGIKDAPNKYFVGENYLKQLDMDGNTIEGNLADKYILKK